MENYKSIIENAWNRRELLQDEAVQQAINEVIALLDQGKLRVAEPKDGQWIVNEWIKKAVILYFPIRKMETMEVGMLEFHDKIPLKRAYARLGVRVVPHAIARYGAFLEKG
ncbi:MAG TPA: 2,3,4,5-tetrahydropyridine-2,6-dicarboxylate N-succinyltransferase, partial [Bacteroidales bacterium]|nr:2,3,4,5-tetrahydropyridine-2,6-dicarboxylate N-succinyltransferase [Bacteroidales bacterium]